MTSFHGLPHLGRRERENISLPSPPPACFPPSSVSHSSLIYAPPLLPPSFFFFFFCFSSGFHGPYKPHFSSRRVLLPFLGRGVGSSVARLVPLPRIRVRAQTVQTGAEGLLLGALRCALIRQPAHSLHPAQVFFFFFWRGGGAACGHGYTVISATFIYARAICCQVARE